MCIRDRYGSKRKTKIVADGKVAGYLQKNTVYINEEEWFSIDYVEDEPINDREDVYKRQIIKSGRYFVNQKI